MKVVKFLALAGLLVFVFMAGFLGYMGIFSKMAVEEKIMGPYTLAYESFVGPYSKTGPVFKKVYDSLKADGIETVRGIGIYYDNPKDVPANKLRSDCGSIVEEKDSIKINDLGFKYKIIKIEQNKALVAELKIKNSLSYMIGPMKAYPILAKYAAEKNYKWLRSYELYDTPAKTIYYVVEVEPGK